MTRFDVILFLLVWGGYAIGYWLLWYNQQTLRGIRDALWAHVYWREQLADDTERQRIDALLKTVGFKPTVDNMQQEHAMHAQNTRGVSVQASPVFRTNPSAASVTPVISKRRYTSSGG